MKRYEPLVPIGIFTNANGTYVKVEDVERALDELSKGREYFIPADKTAYRAALEDVRQQVRNGL